MRRRTILPLLGLLALVLPVFTATAAYGHGWVQSPPSRAHLCAQGVVDNCGAIQWEPQSVEGRGGFPQSGPQDGRLCSGGNERFSELDDPRGGDWPAEAVSGGQSISFEWNLTAQHSTAYFEYYITKDGWNPAQPLTRADLEPAPFLHVDYGGEQPAPIISHEGTLPGKSDRHLIFAVWEIADTGNAFYQCMDVDFDPGSGGGDGDDQDPIPGCDAAAWQPNTAYTGGDVVSHEGHEWRAKWWTKQEPTDSQWGPWQDLGACG